MSPLQLSPLTSSYLHFLRAISAQIVCIGHIVLHYHITDSQIVGFLPPFSVLIFFVLSGYLISYTSLRKGVDYGFRNYVIDRFSRIYSALVPALAFTLVILWFYQKDVSPMSVLGSLVSGLLLIHENPLQYYIYLEPYLGFNPRAEFLGGNLPLWSLSLEWWYYMFFGLVFFIPLRKFRLIHILVGVFSLIYVLGHNFIPGRAGYGLSAIWFSGVGLMYLSRVKTSLKPMPFLMALSGVAFVYCVIYAQPFAIIAFIVLYYASTVYFQSKDIPALRWFFSRFTKVANYSYSLYLIHYPLMLLVDTFPISSWLKTGVALTISNIVAIAIYMLFERHHRQLSNYLKLRFSRPKPAR